MKRRKFRHSRPFSSSPGNNGLPDGQPGKPLLRQLLAYHGVKLNNAQLKSLWSYHRLLIRYNRECDLTRLFSFHSIALKHYADCLLIDRFLNGSWPSPLLDIGTGAGLPGILVKILSPDTEIILAEPRPKRGVFLKKAIESLDLKGIRLFPHKVTSNSFSEPVQGCITRAFGSIQTTLPRVHNSLENGGRFLFMKGPAVREELRGFRDPGYQTEHKHFYTIPNSTQKRALIILRRTIHSHLA